MSLQQIIADLDEAQSEKRTDLINQENLRLAEVDEAHRRELQAYLETVPRTQALLRKQFTHELDVQAQFYFDSESCDAVRLSHRSNGHPLPVLYNNLGDSAPDVTPSSLSTSGGIIGITETSGFGLNLPVKTERSCGQMMIYTPTMTKTSTSGFGGPTMEEAYPESLIDQHNEIRHHF
ncbi:unnamed protein product [Protopolystoma xenopodis]|uniref:Uncharacterized protein n=1 Tax=Protopolystoma xenopodis TaxID=117903 RepID=A0A448XNT6_9PLAT|nr:unnamed protein product [Protopolystoma xenopodis]